MHIKQKNPDDQPVIRLCVSVVTYKGRISDFRQTLISLSRSLAYMRGRMGDSSVIVELITIDNAATTCATPAPDQLLSEQELAEFDERHHYEPTVNLGYGKGHNIAIFLSESDFHLVLNPDVLLEAPSIANALEYMAANGHVGIISPMGHDSFSRPLYLCKRYPSLLVLFLRGFCPPFIRGKFKESLEDYEMRELYQPPFEAHEVTVASGCFMFARTDVLKKIHGFSERFFLYFEDFDLSLRVSKVSEVHFVPTVEIIHHGGNSAKKGPKHIVMFFSSALKFFLKNGWRVV